MRCLSRDPSSNSLTGGKGGVLDKTPLPHPAHLDGLAFFNDHRHRTLTVGELEHPLVSLAVVLHVVLHKFYSAPFEIFAGGRAVRTTGRGVEFYLHASILANRCLGAREQGS